MIGEKALRTLFNLAADAMFILDKDGLIKEVNQIAFERLGYTKADMLGKHIGSFILPEFAAKLENQLTKVQKNGYLAYESAQVRKDGSVLPVEISSRAVVLDGDAAIFSVVRDISKRKQIEMHLRESEEKWRLLFENMTTGFALHQVICNEQGQPVDYRFLEINPAYEQVTGLKANKIIGHTVLEVLPGTEPYWIEIFGHVALSGEPTLYENYSKELGRWYQVRVFSPKIGQFAVIVTDITEPKKTQEALEIALEFSNNLVSTMQDGFSVLDKHGCALDANLALCRMTGFSREELIGSSVPFPYWPPDEYENIQKAFQKTLKGEVDSFELTFMRKSGERFPVIVSPSVVKDRNGNTISYTATVKDITERKQAEADFRIAATAFESQESLMITDPDGVILRVNKAFTKNTGYTTEEIVGQTPRLFKSGRQDAEFYRAMWETLLRTGAWQGEIWDRRKSGEIYPKWLSISAVKGSDGAVTHYVGSHIDITERKASEEKIQHLAFYDPLTHLPNRRLLLDRLKQALVSSARSGRAGALLFIDLDNFKNLNDTLGHDIGDLLLQQVTQRLETSIREGDTVARLGGDEFVVMLLDLSEQSIEAAAQTEAIGEKILGTLSESYQLGKHAYRCTASIGVTLFSDNQLATDELMKQADIAMYQAKKAGRNALRFFDRQMQENISARVSLEGELHNAIEFQQFHLYYQVQVDSSHRPLGAEALIRWIHPSRGLVHPVQFIPLAEETGLILPIGLWVLDRACAQLKAWEQNALTRDLTLAVNVSAKQFRQTDFVAQVQNAMQCHAINPKLLKLELTESLLQENIEETIATMNVLNKIGVQFSLDDFGTGYSSLQYLKRLPLDQLKIDQSFVRDIGTDSSDIAVVRATIAVARSLDLDVIAEGVETDEQRQLLLKNGCTHYQGYLFGKPVPIEQFEASLKQGDHLQ